MSRYIFIGLLFAAQVSSPQCGSTSSTSPSMGAVAGASNVVPIVVNAGPANNALNEAFVSVTVCVPGTSNCQTIDGIQVDTGSIGLRILSSKLMLPLNTQQAGNGAPLVECLPFLDSITWGPVQTADVRLAGEQASNIPIQVIGTDKFPSIPGDCSSQGPPEETADDLAANGILGIGFFKEDCGLGCASIGAANQGLYYACPSTGACQVTAVPTANQVVNPIPRFSADNNGSVIQLPVVQAGGLPSTTGALIFGIGTQSNNGLGSAKVLTVDGNGNIRTGFNGQVYTSSFIDSGSNGIFFPDTATTGLPDCKNAMGFYCPPSLRPLSATQTGANGVSSVVAFSAGNVDSLNSTFAVLSEATGPQPGGFDWGLPFFYGRTVFTAIEGQATPGGIGPYWAY